MAEESEQAAETVAAEVSSEQTQPTISQEPSLDTPPATAEIAPDNAAANTPPAGGAENAQDAPSAPEPASEAATGSAPEPPPVAEPEPAPAPVEEPKPVDEPVKPAEEPKVEPPAPSPVVAKEVSVAPVTAQPPASNTTPSQSCTSCGAGVQGMKFCGSCGAKVLPSACLVCNTSLIPRAKFCPECGTARGATERPAIQEIPIAPVATTPTLSPGMKTVNSTFKLASPAVEETRQDRAGTREGLSNSSATSPRDGDKPSTEKKKFTVKETPKCTLCSKTVYESEKSLNSAGVIFHKECLRCKTCKASLHGRQPIAEPENGSVKITSSQYLVAREGSQLGDKGSFFCEKHTLKADAAVVKSSPVAEKSRDDGELARVASMRKEQNDDARLSMQMRVGDMLPTCSRCGHPIDKGQRAVTNGIQKMHESCPTKEESEKAIRTTRFFVRKAPDRLAGTLTCDKETKHPHTFLYEMDKNTLTESLKKNGNETTMIRFLPDAQARTAGQRKLVAPSSDANRAFDVHFKDFHEFTFTDPKNGDKAVTPTLDKKKKTLEIRKFFHANGVLQSLVALFSYEEETRLCAAEKIEIVYEMWPPEAAAEMSSQLDPLSHLKGRTEHSPSTDAAMEEQAIPQSPSKDAPAPPAAADTKPSSSSVTEASLSGASGRKTVSGRKKSTKPQSADGKDKKDCAIM